MAELADIDYIKGFLNLLDDDTYNDDLEFLLGVYTDDVLNIFDTSSETYEDIADTLTDREMALINYAIGAGVACHLLKTHPELNRGTRMYKIGKVQKELDRRIAKDAEDWCDVYEALIIELSSEFGETTFGSVKRLGLADEYTRPY